MVDVSHTESSESLGTRRLRFFKLAWVTALTLAGCAGLPPTSDQQAQPAQPSLDQEPATLPPPPQDVGADQQFMVQSQSLAADQIESQRILENITREARERTAKIIIEDNNNYSQDGTATILFENDEWIAFLAAHHVAFFEQGSTYKSIQIHQQHNKEYKHVTYEVNDPDNYIYDPAGLEDQDLAVIVINKINPKYGKITDVNFPQFAVASEGETLQGISYPDPGPSRYIPDDSITLVDPPKRNKKAYPDILWSTKDEVSVESSSSGAAVFTANGELVGIMVGTSDKFVRIIPVGSPNIQNWIRDAVLNPTPVPESAAPPPLGSFP